MIVDPTNSFVYTINMGSDTISAYTLNSTTCSLTQITGSPFLAGTNTDPFDMKIIAITQ